MRLMKLAPLIISVCLLVLSSSTQAQARKPTPAASPAATANPAAPARASNSKKIRVVGVKKCGLWLSVRSGQDESPASKHILQNWVMGYLTGVALASGEDFLRDLDGDAAFMVMDEYCKKNPLKDVIDASEHLIEEIRAL